MLNTFKVTAQRESRWFRDSVLRRPKKLQWASTLNNTIKPDTSYPIKGGTSPNLQY